MADERDDGVQRDKLDYRAGYCEGIAAVLNAINVAALRAKKNEPPGLELAHGIALKLRQDMLAKMSSKGGA